MNRRDFLADSVGLAATVLLCSGCGRGSEAMRYRVTVEVDTPQGLKVGSSVWEVITSRGPGFPGPEAGGLNYRIKGEAVTVDLPDGTLFAVTTSADGSLDYPAYVVEGHTSARIRIPQSNW